MNTLPAQEIKRRGVAAIEERIKNGPLHIIKNNQPRYVVMTEERYVELIETEDESSLLRIKASLEDVKAGRVKKYTSSEDLLRSLAEEEKL